MRIKVIIPFIAPDETLAFIKDFLPEDVEVSGLEGLPVAETKSDTAYALPQLLETIKAAEKAGYDAVVLTCHGDPGVQEARELVNIPVLGPLMVGIHMSSMLGHRFCILTPSQEIRRWQLQNLRAYGFEGKGSVRAIAYSAEKSMDEYNRYKRTGKSALIDEAVSECIKAIEQDDVTVITFGCGGLIWTRDGIKQGLKEKGYDVEVVNPLPTAVELARAMVNLGVSHSRLFYPGHARVPSHA